MHERRGKQDMEVYKLHLQALFDGISAKSIWRDVKTLPELYTELVRIKGAWPAKKFR
jgi:hypothetical protein